MRKIALYLLPLALAVGLFAVFATQIDKDPTRLPSTLLDKPAPAFELPPLEGHDQPGFSTANLKGHLSLVNVFASWCVPCRDEHRFLMDLSRRDDIMLFGINYNDAPEDARSFLAELGNPYDAIGSDHDRRVSLDWGVYGIPESYLVNEQGLIVYKHTGPLNAESYRDVLLPMIEQAQARNAAAHNQSS